MFVNKKITQRKGRRSYEFPNLMLRRARQLNAIDYIAFSDEIQCGRGSENGTHVHLPHREDTSRFFSRNSYGGVYMRVMYHINALLSSTRY